MEFKHVSVLLEETVEALQVKPDGIYVDGTLGGAGHACQICRRLGDRGRFVGIDQDEEAIAVSTERLREFGEKVSIIKSNYGQMKQVLQDLGIHKADGILLDLGVSSYQLDNAERGFSYMADAPLDMRMDREQTVSAKDIVNTYPEAELFRIIREYSESQRKQKHRDDFPAGGYYSQIYAGEGEKWKGTSGKEDISGAPDRVQP